MYANSLSLNKTETDFSCEGARPEWNLTFKKLNDTSLGKIIVQDISSQKCGKKYVCVLCTVL